MRLRTIFMTATLVVSLAPFDAAAVDFTPGELATLKRGEVVQHELTSSRHGGFYGGSGFAIVDAPVDAVWKALQDWGAYAKAFPNTESTELSRKGNRSLIRMRIGHPVVSVQYHVEMTRNDEKKVLSFQMVADMTNDLDDVRGYWRLFPQPDDRTLIAYVLAVRAPMGLVNLIGPKLEDQAINALLNVPGFMKTWIEGPGRSRYR
jgi:carbon monoxide dehydrogenase subunit G